MSSDFAHLTYPAQRSPPRNRDLILPYRRPGVEDAPRRRYGAVAIAPAEGFGDSGEGRSRVFTTVTSRRISTYYCPSDPNNLSSVGIGTVTSQNYVVNFGNSIVTQPQFYLYNNVKLPFLGAPFTDMGSPDTDITAGTQQTSAAGTINFAGIPDGLSTTMLTSEILVGSGWDLRGFSWWGYAAQFTGLLAPNSSSPDVLQALSYCGSVPPNPPCTGATGSVSSGGVYTGLGMVNDPRSKHPGGVNVGMGDGSVRFIKNSVNVFTFQAIASTKGSEVVSSDAY
jgi:prepilin-type processing-associated H-X9-DG protein